MLNNLQFLETAWRRRNLTLGCILLCALIGASLGSFQSNVFLAKIDIACGPVFNGLFFKAKTIPTSVLLDDIYTHFKLDKNPIYNPDLQNDGTLFTSAMRSFYQKNRPEHAKVRERRIKLELLKSLQISGDPYTQDMAVSFTSPSPGLGKAVVEYIRTRYIVPIIAEENITLRQDGEYSTPMEPSLFYKISVEPYNEKRQENQLLLMAVFSLVGAFIGLTASIFSEILFLRKSHHVIQH